MQILGLLPLFRDVLLVHDEMKEIEIRKASSHRVSRQKRNTILLCGFKRKFEQQYLPTQFFSKVK
jgi:hypothetical protein